MIMMTIAAELFGGDPGVVLPKAGVCDGWRVRANLREFATSSIIARKPDGGPRIRVLDGDRGAFASSPVVNHEVRELHEGLP